MYERWGKNTTVGDLNMFSADTLAVVDRPDGNVGLISGYNTSKGTLSAVTKDELYEYTTYFAVAG